MNKPPFVTQPGRASLTDFGCGIACTMMLLKHHCAKNLVPSYEVLANALWADVDSRLKGYPNVPKNRGVYYEDIVAFFERTGVPYVAREELFPARKLRRRLTVAPALRSAAERGVGRREDSE